jgi:hypothetical protein
VAGEDSRELGRDALTKSSGVLRPILSTNHVMSQPPILQASPKERLISVGTGSGVP